ncbi:hypothetical protein KBZ07_10025 [Cyanobium sp. BA20m-14]|uniref:hypothetical protein n=1 Tax=Cyanobium sp. BA20m-14 TaxID=2823703 RepID=UPI0020CD93CB|nr:hypothetical protein [Cyanobium sp. BA20m-14]MCP9913734.1 hypothetical protein [Cyanobium sp. BA20m-14]
MQILHKKLPTIWPLQVGEPPTPASEPALALVELTRDARDDAQVMLAQIGAAPDATPAAIELALQLQQLLAEAVALAVALAVET